MSHDERHPDHASILPDERARVREGLVAESACLVVGRLRCGEWLLFLGVHDLMHLAQLEALEASLA